MILNVLNTLAPLALVAVILASTACKGDSSGAEKEVSKETAKTVKREPVITGIAGLDTERKQFSYMIGMDIGKSIAPVKDEVDMNTGRSHEDRDERRQIIVNRRASQESGAGFW